MRIPRIGAAIIGVLAVASLAACGSSGATPTPTTPIDVVFPTPTTAAATPTPATPTPTSLPTNGSPTPTPNDGGGVDDHLLALGQRTFDETAGGIGCAYCHRADATGNPALGSPDIRGVTADQILDALETRAQMTFITLTDEEVRAVAAYLRTIGNQQ